MTEREIVRPGLIIALAQVVNNDWRISFLAHTSDTAKEAMDTIQYLEREIISLTAQLAKCREATVEECAKVALGHKGRAAQERRTKTLKHSYRLMSEEMKLEIQAEEHGEDIAAEEIAKAIRALTT